MLSHCRLSRAGMHGKMSNLKLPGKITKDSEEPVTHGSRSNVYLGTWVDLLGKENRVAIKVIRDVSLDETDLRIIRERADSEARVWYRLNHQNVFKLLGTWHDNQVNSIPAFITSYCPNGAVMRYLASRPDADRLQLVRGIARGLAYIHSQRLVHGNLTPSNILVCTGGIPRISDFGRSRIVQCRGHDTSSMRGFVRYMAPELMRPSANPILNVEFRLPKELPVDVFSFAMVALHVMTGEEPFYWIRSSHQITVVVCRGERPPPSAYYPTTFPANFWQMLQDCWKQDPEKRMEMQTIVACVS